MFFEELKERVTELIGSKYEITKTNFVPERDDATFKTKTCLISTAVLNIDIRDSTRMLKKYKRSFIAKTLRIFHLISAKIIKENDGDVRSFNGDSLLAFFNADLDPCNNAVESAFYIKYSINKLIRPYFKEEFDYGIGIDYGEILVTKAGFPGFYNNDLLWIGLPVNHAVKMSNKAETPYNIRISNTIYKNLRNANKRKSKEIIPGFAARPLDIWKKTLIGPPLFTEQPVTLMTDNQRAL